MAKKDELLINDAINVKELMVIGPNGEQMGIKSREDALTVATFAGLDLVLMNGTTTPAVGKIMDYNKFRYEKQKKQREAMKKQRETNKDLKEYRLSPDIDNHDFMIRIKNAREYLQKGHKVRGFLRFKGRQITHPERGRQVLTRFAEELKDISNVEVPIKQDGRVISVILAPIK